MSERKLGAVVLRERERAMRGYVIALAVVGFF
jgi:hypothetical protein